MTRPEVPQASPRDLMANARWALRTVWATQPRIMLALLLLTMLRGLLPAGLALFARGLVNALVAVIDSQSLDLAPVYPWLALGFGLTLLEAAAPLVNKYAMQRLKDELNLKITADILEHAATLDLAFFEDPNSQRIVERAQQNTSERFARFIQELIGSSTGLVQILSLAGVLAYIEPLVLLVLGPLGLPYLWQQWRLARRHYQTEFRRTAKRRWSQYFVSQLTHYQNIPEARLFNLAPLFTRRFKALMAEFRDQDLRLYRRRVLGSASFAALATVAFFVLFLRVVQRAFEGALTVGDVAVFGVASSRLRATLDSTIVCLSGALEQTLYIANLREFLRARPLVLDSTAGARPAAPAPRHGALSFEAVSFTYPSAKQPTLRDLSFAIEPGQIVGIVGENGAGKTTLVKLICRLYDASAGQVKVDGRDVRDYRIAELQGAITFVLQHFGRYEATAGENIAYGNWKNLLHDREQIRRIARVTGAHALISSLPEKYDTMLGRVFGNLDLSGGQWQILAAARAYARDARILILDEPTAHLDARAEYELFRKFRELARGRTTLLISHRFSTLRMADRILVLHEGSLIEDGTHEQLVAQSGHYASLYALHRSQVDGD